MEMTASGGIMTDINNEARWMALSKVDGLGAVGAQMLIEAFGDTMGVFEADKAELLNIKFLKPEIVKKIISVTEADPMTDYERFRDSGICYYSIEHPLYPGRLRQIDSPPIGLFVKGKLPEEGRKAAGVVGSRTSSSYGRAVCDLFCREFAKEKIDVISGMAVGIDECAHNSTLAAGGMTYAVLGCGVDVCYPSVNYTLYEKIIEKGGVISEFYPGSTPIAMRFPMRNRIIAGLSDAILAVEARRKSGTLITVGCALDQGKEVYSVPGRLTDKLSEGCNGLIAIGARIALSPKEMADDIKNTVYAETGSKYERHEHSIKKVNRYKQATLFDKKARETEISSEDAKTVFLATDVSTTTVEEIAEKTGFDIGKLMGILGSLELDGFIRQEGPGAYARVLMG